jgi:two-component system chemotaxis sensor kinase CheA
VQDKDSATASSSENAMRVDTDKVDALLNLVGELAITQSMLSQISHHFELSLLPKLNAGIARLEHHARDMQQAVMQMQMLPISNAFNFLSRRVQNLADSLGKKVNFKVSGEKVELDKTILEQVIPPLSHLIRNAMEQGFENPDVRSAAGKSATGLLQLKAYSHGSHIIIEVSDDGAGLDEVKILQKAIEKGLVSESEVLSTKAIHKLIFQSGFSTTDNISEFSGDITGAVSENIRDMGGSIEVMSEIGKGTVFTLRLPVTLAIIEGQTIKVAEQHYILPLTSIIESFEIEEAEVQQVLGKGELYPFHGDYIPILRLYQLFNLSPTLNAAEPQLLIIVEAEGDKVALYVDELISQQHVVIKSLETHYQKVIGFSGATITGNGNVTLILDISALIKHYKSGGSTVFLSDEEETIA